MNYKKSTILALVLLFGTQVHAQTPRWYKSVSKSILSIVTFDEKNQLLHSGNAIIVNKDGTALTSFQLFKNAYSAKAIDRNGNEYPVKWICGASSLYDIVHFQLDIKKKIPALKLAENEGAQGDKVYILPHANQKKRNFRTDSIIQVQTFDEKFHYYTLSGTPSDLHTNVPVSDENGKVLAMLQQSSDKKKNYAISVKFGISLTTNAMSAADSDLNSIHIAKKLPDTENAATTFLFLANNKDSLLYDSYLTQYIDKFPKNSNGYTTAAQFFMQHGNLPKAKYYLENGLENSSDKSQLLYTWSKLIYTLNTTEPQKVLPEWSLQNALDKANAAYETEPLPIYMIQQGHCLYALKQYDKAYQAFMKANDSNLKSSELFLYAAQCKKMMQADNYEILALQDSALSMQKEPYTSAAAPIFLARANTYIELQKYKHAVVDLNKYESLMQGRLNATFYYLRSKAELNGKMFEQAVYDIDRAIKLEPKNALLHAQKAATCYAVGLQTDAIAAAQESIRLNPEFADAHRILGVCLIQSGQAEEGKTCLQKAIALGDSLAKDLLLHIKE